MKEHLILTLAFDIATKRTNWLRDNHLISTRHISPSPPPKLKHYVWWFAHIFYNISIYIYTFTVFVFFTPVLRSEIFRIVSVAVEWRYSRTQKTRLTFVTFRLEALPPGGRTSTACTGDADPATSGGQNPETYVSLPPTRPKGRESSDVYD